MCGVFPFSLDLIEFIIVFKFEFCFYQTQSVTEKKIVRKERENKKECFFKLVHIGMKCDRTVPWDSLIE